MTRRCLQSAAGESPKGSANAAKPTIKQLIKKYGYSALGVYLGISAIDLPLSFLFVHSMGQDQILVWENSVREFFGYEPKVVVAAAVPVGLDGNEKTADNSSMLAAVSAWLGPTFWTEFGIAYALHKSLIFIRVPLTAAITPGLVKLLQKWGFNIGKKAAK
ncbi:hypothetical protein D0Z03_001069 [Geotrichum reessii]|nr:hypothetical protein D0Z03_001069 [Galactomyces reessii]